MPFAEVVESPHLHKLLLRGCSSRPHGKDTLCQKHAAARDKQLPPIDPSSQVSRHRLRKALHADGDVCHFEVQIAGFRGWQPACTINADVLAQHFARQADSNIRRRRERRVEARKQKWTGMRPRRARTFLAPWHSAGPKQESLGKQIISVSVFLVFSLGPNCPIMNDHISVSCSCLFIGPRSPHHDYFPKSLFNPRLQAFRKPLL